jgi:tetratricopeptide (TPR) repeat protein
MTPEELQQSLFNAILQDDQQTVIDLCNAHADAIVENFPAWKKVPANVRANEQAVQAWGHCLMTLANLFESAGIPDLMESLTGGADNVITRWTRTVAHATALAKNGDYLASTELLAPVAAEMEGAQGNVVDDYRAKVYGLLGTNAFHLGRPEEARRLTTLALEECRRTNDAAGVRTYTENLRVLAVATMADSTEEHSARVRRIRAAIAQAQDLSDLARFDQSNDLLDTALADIRAAGNGPGSEYAGKAFGLLGLNFLRIGDAARAREHTVTALEHCRAKDDTDGIRIYTANLANLDRSVRK